MSSGATISPPPHHTYGLILGNLTVDDLDRDGTREEGCRTSTAGGHSRKEIYSTSAMKGPRSTVAPLSDYEKLRAQQIMKNNQVLQSIGLGALTLILKSAHVEDEDPQKSGSEYDPGLMRNNQKKSYLLLQKDQRECCRLGSNLYLTWEIYSMLTILRTLMRRLPGKVKNQTSDLPTDGLKFRSRDGLSLHDDNIDMTTEGDSIPQPDDDNHMDTKDVIFQHNDNIDMTIEGDSIPWPDEDNHMDTEDAIFSTMTTFA
ncbi:hypothetical protein GUJ93_ZPchr0006g45131 [Zizania palustris]|uniref:Uncharacterized protein n=1 Tax=Zizania palustris TaxID=103762 RepID=A0A8J5SN66_ZIZPA|nr:hypothetical protein GUJ93_ZPchr0006g45131 [Zizania palustris]